MVDTWVDAAGVPAVAAAIVGPEGVRDQRVAGEAEPGSLFALASLTKPIVALAVLVAVEEGAVDLDEPVGRHLAAYAAGPRAAARHGRRRRDAPATGGRWPQLRVVGCDIAEAQLAYARRVLAADIAAGAVELMRASATAVPLPAASADAGFVCWLLEHVDNPAAVMREVARVVRPGGRVFVTEVYNHSLTLEPSQPPIDRFWSAVNTTQRLSGGHPNIGARLGELAAAANLEIVSHRFVPVIGDARDPAARTALLRYFRALMKSSAPQLLAARAFDERDLPSVWAAWDAVESARDGLFCYTMSKLEARVR